MLVVCFALTGCLQKKEKEDDVQVNDSSTNFPQPTVKAEADDSYKDNNFVVENGIQYESLEFVDSVQLQREPGKGWLIDLNGDGEQEKIYAGEEGLYIEGSCVLSSYGNIATLFPNDLFWLLDIDTTDSYIEILLDRYFYTLAYYTTTGELITQPDVCGYYDSSDYATAKDIRRPRRVDEHTISFWDGHSEFSFHQANMNYRLDEEHKLIVIPGEYEIDFPHPFAYLNQEVPLKLYQERDFNGKYLEVLGPQVYMFNKSDGTGWIYLENYFGESGWIHTGKNEDGVWCINQIPYTQGDFIGFSNIP